MTYTPEGDRLHRLFIKGLERQQAMGSNAYTDSRFIDHGVDTSEHQAIAELRETMAERAQAADKPAVWSVEQARVRQAGPLPGRTAVSEQVTDEILCYAKSFGQPLYLAFAVRVALVLQDRGLLADD